NRSCSEIKSSRGRYLGCDSGEGNLVSMKQWLANGSWAALVLALLARSVVAAPDPTPALPQANAAQVGFSAERLGRLDAYMKQQVAGGHIPGAVILLARHGKVVAFNSYGEADRDRHVPMRKDTIFRIYSQTKLVTAVAMLMLFEEGKWHLDDPITRF